MHINGFFIIFAPDKIRYNDPGGANQRQKQAPTTMTINFTKPYFGTRYVTAYRDDRTLLMKSEWNLRTIEDFARQEETEKELTRMAQTLETTLAPGERAVVEIWQIHQDWLDATIEISTSEDYRASIQRTGKNEYTLEEDYYPNSGKQFSTEAYPGTDQTQINIFGSWKTLGGALKSYQKHGNSTHNNRKPIEIYV